MSERFKAGIFLSLFLIPFLLKAQNTSFTSVLKENSPYSRLGVGDILPLGNVRNLGMGGAGVASLHPEFINIYNPAALSANRLFARMAPKKPIRNDSIYKFTVFDAGLRGSYHNLKSGSGNSNNLGLNFFYFNFAFPVSPKWSMSAGLQQSTNVSYNLQQTSTLNGYPLIYEYQGNGGLYKFHWANGVELTKNLALGAEANYYFGNVTDDFFSQVQVNDSLIADPTTSDKANLNRRIIYRTGSIKPGILYKMEFKDTSGNGNGVFLNIGLTYEYFMKGNSEMTQKLSRTNYANGIFTDTDTTMGDVKLKYVMPGTFKGGLALEKLMTWSIAADFSYSNWSTFQGGVSQEQLKNSYSFNLGGEYTFMLKAKEQDKDLRRRILRGGICYMLTPYVYQGKQIRDISGSVGTSINLPRSNRTSFRYKTTPKSKINFALQIGKRGQSANNGIRDFYGRVYMSFILHDKWFERFRID